MAPCRLRHSIGVTIASLALFQSSLVGVTTLAYRLPVGRSVAIAAAILAYHGALAAVLLALRPLFALEKDGAALERVNAPNVLSLARLSSLPTIVFLVLAARGAPLLPVVLPFLIAVFLTDLLDGWLARRLSQVTRIGRYLDAFSDYAVIAATLVVFLLYGLIPLWFFSAVIVRLAVVVVGNTLLYFLLGYVEPETSFLSKASIFATMALLAAKVAQTPYHWVFGGPSPLSAQSLDALQLMVTGVLIVSTIEKADRIGRKLLQAWADRRDATSGSKGGTEAQGS